MPRRAVFLPYRPKTILNKHKRADHWFWTRYSAYPYIGCQHGCEFCYCRERKYAPYDDPQDFAYVIKVKENAPDLLRRALGRVPVEAVFTGDYQAAERKFEISRRMLEVCRDLGFPVFVLERSPLVVRDMDLLQDIHTRARAVVAFSIIAAPDSPAYDRVRVLERLSPDVGQRFRAMERFARAGITTGTCFMPILPGLCDEDSNLETVVRRTADHGGSFVLAGGLTLADQQRAYFLSVLGDRFPELVGDYEALYPPGSYAAAGYDQRRVARRVRELCMRHGLSDRIPRPILAGDKRAVNKRVVEALANRLYAMDLEGESQPRVWAYRKAAWAIEDLEQDVGLVFRTLGRKGLESIQGVGRSIASEVEGILLAATQEART
ncbi:MAG TPA: radical SAM protein [Anaerolineales bacterium]|nr:radical SAM protein [Anaerolineales bacterium]